MLDMSTAPFYEGYENLGCTGIGYPLLVLKGKVFQVEIPDCLMSFISLW